MMTMMKKVMISQPMNGLDNKEIQETRDRAIKWIDDNGYKFQDSFVTEQVPTDIVNSSVWYLAKSLEFMSKVDAVYFCKDWETARGCVIEHAVASEYGLDCIYEETSEEDEFLKSMNNVPKPVNTEDDDALKVFMQPTVSSVKKDDMTSDNLDEWKL